MAPGDSGFAGDVFDTGWRGFLTAVLVLRLALAVWVAFLPFVLFLAITPPLDHLAHRVGSRRAPRW
jgi:hypothetical protein